jgi:O-antigen/teichoic acid export membrane protein
VGFQRYDLVSVVTVVTSTLSLLGTILILSLDFGVKGLITILVGMYFIQIILYTGILFYQKNLRPFAIVPTDLIKRVVRYCIGVFVITTFDAIVWQSSETFFLGRYSTTEQIAYYGLAYSIATALAVTLPTALTGILLPTFSSRFGAHQREGMQNLYAISTKYASIITLPICLGGIVVSMPLVQLLYGASFIPSVYPLRILFISGALGAMAVPGSALFLALGKPDRAILWGIPLAILNLVLAYLLIPEFGATGAAIANSISQILAVLVGTSYLILVQKFRLSFRSLFRSTIAACISGISAFLVIQLAPGWLGLVAGILIGAIIYVPNLFFTRSLNSTDIQLMREITPMLPERFSSGIIHMIDMVEVIDNWVVSLRNE